MRAAIRSDFLRRGERYLFNLLLAVSVTNGSSLRRADRTPHRRAHRRGQGPRKTLRREKARAGGGGGGTHRENWKITVVTRNGRSVSPDIPRCFIGSLFPVAAHASKTRAVSTRRRRFADERGAFPRFYLRDASRANSGNQGQSVAMEISRYRRLLATIKRLAIVTAM